MIAQTERRPMAKKKAEPVRRSRKDKMEIERIREGIERLEFISGQLGTMADDMEDRDVKSIEMDGVNLLDRGLQLLSRFAGHLNLGIEQDRF